MRSSDEYLQLVRQEHETGDFLAGITVCQEGLKHYPQQSELWVALIMTALFAQEYQLVVQAHESYKKLPEKETCAEIALAKANFMLGKIERAVHPCTCPAGCTSCTYPCCILQPDCQALLLHPLARKSLCGTYH